MSSTTQISVDPTDGPGEVDLPTPVLRSLSPSRAGDFKTCPLLYRFRCIDRLPERPSPDAVRGTVVHAVLERLYDLPAAERTKEAATALVGPQWERLLEEEPVLAELWAADPDDPADPDVARDTRADELAGWLDSARRLVEGYFTLEDPTRLEPAERECLVETVLDDGLLLRGYVDRLDVAPTGEVRVVDYKTGGAPREAYEGRALFQMKFYALVLWRMRGVVPRQLRLIYLKDRDTLTYAPDEEELRRFSRTLQAIWAAITRATREGDFRPSPGPLCAWCDHRALCPVYGGTPPPYPGAEIEQEATPASRP
jgi:putative RecB family exonuclease